MAATVYTPVAFSLTGGIDLSDMSAIDTVPGDLALDTFPNTGKELFVHINAESSVSHTVTFTENKCSLGVEHDKTETTLAGKSVPYGPFPTSKFGSTISVAYDATTISSNKITIVVLQMPIVG